MNRVDQVALGLRSCLSGSNSAPIYAKDGSGDRQKEEGSRGKAKQEVREIQGERVGAAQSENVGQPRDTGDRNKNQRGDGEPPLANASLERYPKKQVGTDYHYV